MPPLSPASRRRRVRALHMLLLIGGATLGIEMLLARIAPVQQWSSWLVQLVFPSQNVTWAKVACVLSGFVLTFYHFVVRDVYAPCSSRSVASLRSPRSQQQHELNKNAASPSFCASQATRTASPTTSTPTAAARTFSGSSSRGPTPLRMTMASEEELPQLQLVDEIQSPGISSSSSACEQRLHVNGKHPIAFENELFKGTFLFMVRDSNPPRSSNNSVSTKTNWSHLFNGRKRTLWVQVQGRFKRASPPNSTLFLAAEVPSRLTLGFWIKKLVEVLVSIMKKISRHVHVSFGDGDSDSGELPHAAFPLYQTVDEFVETPIADATAAPHRVPTLGTENFGESKQQQQLRMRSNGDNGRENSKVFTPDNIYTFQFYTMYADLAQWKIANLPGMPEIPLTKFCGDQPIRFAAYLLTPPSDGGGEATDSTAKPHSKALKDYLFCFSVHYNEANTRPVSHLVGTPSGSSNLICSPTASSLRSTLSESSIPAEDEPPAPRITTQSRAHGATNLPLRLARHEEALTNLTFELPMWIERVDPVAGNRKVSYLFVVNEQVVDDGVTNSFQPTARSSHRYVVIRSASTIKNALLMLRDDADVLGDQREERAVSGNSRSHEDDFKKLLVESREFLYESITNETNTVAAALQRIAATSTSDRSAYHLDKLKKAMLHHCLKSSGTLPRVRSYQEIGIQLTKAKRERMDTIWECGVYRVHSRQVLRQEWLMLTTNQVHFFRSYTMRACKSLDVVDILRVEYVNAPHVLCPEVLHEGYDEEDRQVKNAATADATQWHCVQLHLMSEVVTLFVDSEDARRHLATSLNQIVQLQVRPGRLPASRTFESQPTPLCLNRRSALPTLSPPSESTAIAATSKTNRGALRQSDALTLAQEILQKGLTIYNMRPRDRKPSDLLAFLDAVELLNDLELPGQDDPAGPLLLTSLNSPMNAMLKPPLSHEEKLAFALNLYHILYIHATLVFVLPTSHFQWKKLQSVPYYLIGSAKCPQKQLRVTLEAIEHGMLRASIPSIALSTSSHIGSARRLGSSSPSSPSNGSNQYDVPRHLVLASSDFRTNFALQLNCSPGTEVIRVYSGSDEIHAQLNATSTLFLSKELSVDAHARVIWLPKICDWHQSDFMPRCSRTAAGLLNGSRAFYCLQKLLGFLDTQQREQVQQVILGGGKSSRVLYGTFWTQSSRIVLPGASNGTSSPLKR